MYIKFDVWLKTSTVTRMRFCQYWKRCSPVKQRNFGGKRGSHRHSTTSFSENVVVTETSNQCKTFYHFAIRRRLNLPK